MSVPNYLHSTFEGLAPYLFAVARHYELHGRGYTLIPLLEDAISTADHDTAVRLSGALAAIIWKRGRHEEATDRLMATITYGRDEVQDPYLMSDALYWLGDIQYVEATLIASTDLSAAWQNHQQALAIRQKVDDQAAVALSLSRLGTLYERDDDMETALEYYRRATELSEKLNYARGMTRPLLQIGGYFRQRNDWAQAAPYFKKALRLSHEIGDEESMAFAHVDLARSIYATEEDFDTAIRHLSRALDIANRSGFILSKCRTLQVMATIYIQSSKGAEAVLTLQRVIEIARPAGYRIFVEGAERQLALLQR